MLEDFYSLTSNDLYERSKVKLFTPLVELGSVVLLTKFGQNLPRRLAEEAENKSVLRRRRRRRRTRQRSRILCPVILNDAILIL